MFIDSEIALISNEELEAAEHLKGLGVSQSSTLSSEDFTYRPFRIRVEDIKYVYQTLDEQLIVIELYDTEGNFMLKDNVERIKKLMDDYYSTQHI